MRNFWRLVKPGVYGYTSQLMESSNEALPLAFWDLVAVQILWFLIWSCCFSLLLGEEAGVGSLSSPALPVFTELVGAWLS